MRHLRLAPYLLIAQRGIPGDFARLAHLGTEHLMYVPWMQATYIMAAAKEALQYLPAGATLDSLTYDQLGQWAANADKATGRRVLGFPAGPTGLMIASSRATCWRRSPAAW